MGVWTCGSRHKNLCVFTSFPQNKSFLGKWRVFIQSVNVQWMPGVSQVLRTQANLALVAPREGGIPARWPRAPWEKTQQDSAQRGGGGRRWRLHTGIQSHSWEFPSHGGRSLNPSSSSRDMCTSKCHVLTLNLYRGVRQRCLNKTGKYHRTWQ